MRDRLLFVKWFFLNALTVVFLIAMTLAYGGRVHGPSLVAIPVILAVYAFAQFGAAKICWRANEVTAQTASAWALLHEAKFVRHWAEQVQYLAMLATVFGIWKLLTDQGGNLHDRLINGGGVAFSATFVGVFASLFLMQTLRMIEHDLEG